MFDAMKLLGSIAEHQSAPSAADRFGAAVQQDAGGAGMLQQLLGQLGGSSAQPGGLGSLLGGLAGQQGGAPGSGGWGAAQGGLGGALGGLAEMAKRAASSPRQEIASNNPAAVGGLGALAGALLGGGRGAMGGGLMAVLGSLAASALQAQASTTAATRPAAGGAGSGQMGSAGMGGMAAAPASRPVSQSDLQRRATLVIRAMIQAAKADGQVDQQEVQRIIGKLDEHGHDSQARDFVASEMRRPIDIGGLVRDVTTPPEAVEVYAASLMAIEVDSQAERDYLADLAKALRLPDPVVARLHAALGVPV